MERYQNTLESDFDTFYFAMFVLAALVTFVLIDKLIYEPTMDLLTGESN